MFFHAHPLYFIFQKCLTPRDLNLQWPFLLHQILFDRGFIPQFDLQLIQVKMSNFLALVLITDRGFCYPPTISSKDQQCPVQIFILNASGRELRPFLFGLPSDRCLCTQYTPRYNISNGFLSNMMVYTILSVCSTKHLVEKCKNNRIFVYSNKYINFEILKPS